MTHPRSNRLVLFATAAVVLAAALPSAAAPPDPTLESYARAREVVDAAVAATGGAARINAITTLVVEQSGTGWSRNQSPQVAPPFASNPQQGRIILDLAGGRLSSEISGGFPGGTFATRTVITPEEKFVLDLQRRTVQPNDALALVNFDFFHRLMPPLLLRKALQQAASLRWLGRRDLDGRPHDLVTFAWDNGLTPTVYIDAATHLVSKYELLFPDNLTGDAVSELSFPGYREVSGVQVPTGYVQHIAGVKATELRYDEVRIDAPVDEAAFEVPFGFRPIAPPPTGDPRVVELAKDVYMIEGLANWGYNFFFVAFDEYLVAFDASVSRAVSARAIALIKEKVPDRPIRYLVLSHHHDDHSGGVGAFVDEGAIVITTAANRAYLEEMAASVSSLDGPVPEGDRGTPSFELVSGTRTFKDATHEVVVHDIGPSPHAAEMLVMYLPAEKILFEADLLNTPRSGPVGPAGDVTVHFAEAIRRLGLEVGTIVGIHGGVGSTADLEDALRRRAAR
ncbi:MAG: MBL fold metallo-hydrolase [Thermoanaerobaculales bacterium]|nr:MBL fold metallo-hydrolase [Thermoanaerobaculales bacterium]